MDDERGRNRSTPSDVSDAVTGGSVAASVRRAATLVGIWSIPAVLGAAGYAFGERAGGGGTMRASQYVGHSFALWWVWVPVTPIIAVHLRRPAPRLEQLLKHVTTLLLVLVAQTWLTTEVGRMTGHSFAAMGLRQNLVFALEQLLPFDVLVYVAVVAVIARLDVGERYRARDLRASQLETQLERARLAALQTQLQPHFLFNALNTVAMLIRCNRKEEAVDTVADIGELLRHVLEASNTPDIPLADELGFVRRYLDVAQMRMRERLQVSIELSDAVADVPIPSLLLQPLVENALKHGAGTPTNHIDVRCAARGGYLHLEVADTGPGLPPEFSLDTVSGIGLRNVRQRLQTQFGAEARLTIRGGVGSGTVASIDIPLPHRGHAR